MPQHLKPLLPGRGKTVRIVLAHHDARRLLELAALERMAPATLCARVVREWMRDQVRGRG